MTEPAMRGGSSRRYGIIGRGVAALLGVPIVGAGIATIVVHGWTGVLEGLPAIALGACGLYLAWWGREPSWWRSS